MGPKVKLALTPLSSLVVNRYFIPAHNLFPNTSIQNKPLLHYRHVFPRDTSSSKMESHLKAIRAVFPKSRWTMLPRTFFHATSHKVLCVSNGRARLLFGGDDNPGGVKVTAVKGDVLIVPAGVAQRMDKDLDAGFLMVIAFSRGYKDEKCYGVEGEEEKVRGIENVPWFKKDPIYGAEGPALEV
ncbi:hypothetical protein GGS23DRAFT_207073 [Durotheca rogersii]|uniref:uncharacterized protein n=1 Tax=Durotheca rogersii TaxID=419775 RepID=UPI0022204BC8|nr:uncharacterized protein GGS23DRAFT_207073 [Durotheca rogersii]KAI5861057.1 hypothetical protein GGS23DRAFT_207073 [Durotheca rogersii]